MNQSNVEDLERIKKKSVTPEIIKIINKLFSYRRKKLSNILKHFGKESSSEKRLDELTVEEIVDIAKQIQQK